MKEKLLLNMLLKKLNKFEIYYTINLVNMPVMLYNSLFWKINREYNNYLREKYQEKKCKNYFKLYLNYLESKDIKVKYYISMEKFID